MQVKSHLGRSWEYLHPELVVKQIALRIVLKHLYALVFGSVGAMSFFNFCLSVFYMDSYSFFYPYLASKRQIPGLAFMVQS